jgi:hypothetical protein
MTRRSGSGGRGPLTRRLHGQGARGAGTTSTRSSAAAQGNEPDLLHDIRTALRSSHPLGLLALASTLLTVVDPRQVDNEPDTTFTELDLADARARVTEAIERAAITYPPLVTETWPACRPLVEWVVRHLPPGGTGSLRPDWPEEARDELVEDFLTSPHAPDVAVEDARDLAHVMVWFACDYGPGDPLRWSTVSVEIFLTDFLARKALFAQKTLRRAPKVLAAFVRFAHDQRGIRREVTEDTLASIEHHAPEFRRQLEGEPQGFSPMLADSSPTSHRARRSSRRVAGSPSMPRVGRCRSPNGCANCCSRRSVTRTRWPRSTSSRCPTTRSTSLPSQPTSATGWHVSPR